MGYLLGVKMRTSAGTVNLADSPERCTAHKTANVLDKLPTSVQPAAKRDLRQIWTAPDRKAADAAIALFAEKYGAKYERAVACLTKDRGCNPLTIRRRISA